MKNIYNEKWRLTKMKKTFKIIMVVIMLLGIAFSISNFTSMELKANGLRGMWDYDDGKEVCMGDGDECDIFTGFPPD